MDFKLENNITTIIWDWNGTLLNDVDICIEAINELLFERNLPSLSKDKYLEIFGFPVIDYYKQIGFNFEEEPFEIPAHQYIDIYSLKLHESNLHSAAKATIQFFKQKNYKQIILSASEQNKLKEAVQHFGIFNQFEALAGLDHHFATSKTKIGKELLKQLGINPNEACLIGDTTHDYEVAQEIGCHCILVGNGHQQKERLTKVGAQVVNNLTDLTSIF